MEYLFLEGIGAAIWFVVILKAGLEFRHVLGNYKEDIFIEGSIIKTHQQLSGLIFILAASMSMAIAQVQYHNNLEGMYRSGLWVTAVLIRLMVLYQVELYRQERCETHKRVGLVEMFKINFKRHNGKIIEVDKE
jgi:heme/copper-type cytochrome/quinol oxidase subunit 3